MLPKISFLLKSHPFLILHILLTLLYLIGNINFLFSLKKIRLVENIGTLASVYGKTPEQFVKKLRESQNQKELEDQDEDEYDTNEDSSGQTIGSYQSQAINQGKFYSLITQILIIL